MKLELDFTYKEMRDYLRNHGYKTFRVNTWNSDIDERMPEYWDARSVDRIVEVEVAYKANEDVRINTRVGSRGIYLKYGLEVQFMREIKNKLLNL